MRSLTQKIMFEIFKDFGHALAASFRNDERSKAYAPLVFVLVFASLFCSVVTIWFGRIGYDNILESRGSENAVLWSWVIAVIMTTIVLFLSGWATTAIQRGIKRKGVVAGSFAMLMGVIVWLSFGITDTYVSVKGATMKAHDDTQLEGGIEEDATTTSDSAGVPAPTLLYASEISRIDNKITEASASIKRVGAKQKSGHRCTSGMCKDISTSKGYGAFHWKGNITPYGRAYIKDSNRKIAELKTERKGFVDLQQSNSSILIAAVKDRNSMRIDVRAIKESVFKWGTALAYFIQLLCMLAIADYVEGLDKDESVQQNKKRTNKKKKKRTLGGKIKKKVKEMSAPGAAANIVSGVHKMGFTQGYEKTDKRRKTKVKKTDTSRKADMAEKRTKNGQSLTRQNVSRKSAVQISANSVLDKAHQMRESNVRITLKSLASRLGVNERTVRRKLSEMEMSIKDLKS